MTEQHNMADTTQPPKLKFVDEPSDAGDANSKRTDKKDRSGGFGG